MDDFFNWFFRNLFRSRWISNFQLALSGPCTGDFFVSFHASLNNFLFAEWQGVIFNDFSRVWNFDVFFFRHRTFDTTVNDLGAHVFGNMLRCRNWISYFLAFLGLVGGQNFFFTRHSFDRDFFLTFHHAFIFNDFSSKWNWFLFGFRHGATNTDMDDFINRFFDDAFVGRRFTISSCGPVQFEVFSASLLAVDISRGCERTITRCLVLNGVSTIR